MGWRILNAFQAFVDALRSERAAELWIASLTTSDSSTVRKKVLDRVARFPRVTVNPGRIEALLKVDAFLQPVLAELTQAYTASYRESADVELHAWHAAFDLVKAFVAAYEAALRSGYVQINDPRWRAVLPAVLLRLASYRGLDGKFRLFRFSHWRPAQWSEFHELYEFARSRGWHRKQLVFAATRTGIAPCVEQEYLKTLLLMRLDSGNFTADQVEWVALQLNDWLPSLALTPPPRAGARFCVDLRGTQGLDQLPRPNPGTNVLFLDAAPLYAEIAERMRRLSEPAEVPQSNSRLSGPMEAPHATGLALREQRLVLTRLASLFGPEALAVTPRAARFQIDHEARVVVGLQAVCSAIADREKRRGASLDEAAIEREVAEVAAAVAERGSLARRVIGSTWSIDDASVSGCRLTAAVDPASIRLGDLLTVEDEEACSLGVVRRMQRGEIHGTTLGVEIIARRFVRVSLRGESGSVELGGSAELPVFAVYLPTHPENRATPRRSLIGPEDQCVAGGMVELETRDARYLIRFAPALEQQNGWIWAPFAAVRRVAAQHQA